MDRHVSTLDLLPNRFTGILPSACSSTEFFRYFLKSTKYSALTAEILFSHKQLIGASEVIAPSLSLRELKLISNVKTVLAVGS